MIVLLLLQRMTGIYLLDTVSSQRPFWSGSSACNVRRCRAAASAIGDGDKYYKCKNTTDKTNDTHIHNSQATLS